MSRDQVVGAGLLIISVLIVAIYVWLVFFPPMAGADIFVLKLTGAIAVIAVFAIIGWIGYTLATTPPPKPIEEIEKEIEGELKKIEGGSEVKKQGD
ncbi:MAG: transcriptional regulator [Candidatus Nezhaarchaeota archaeon]|nr:transcriptional regulator [Candidatus Nezhaarchaeota archaeon]MCX8142199.1 transcriptional regulator [Candidatus Nezhaarchaeota archaeon]MDW8050018.1 transcriptional regulator [Nitrososphaerota archaeon]